VSGGRPKRPLPPGIGRYPDEAVAAHEGTTPAAIEQLRRRRGIPPASDRPRAEWERRTGRNAEEALSDVPEPTW